MRSRVTPVVPTFNAALDRFWRAKLLLRRAKLPAIEPRQYEIQQHEIRPWFLSQARQRPASIRNDIARVAFRFEDGDHLLTDVRIVFDDQDPGGQLRVRLMTD